MKKVLFTLATLFAVALTAAAGNNPIFGFNVDEVEVTPAALGQNDPGVSVNIDVIGDGGSAILGGQLQWVMYDAEHNVINDQRVYVKQQNAGTPRQPNWVYFMKGVVATEMSQDVSDSFKDGGYRTLFVSMGGNDIFMGDEYAYYSAQGVEAVLFNIQVAAVEGWDEEFATLELTATDNFQLFWSYSDGSQGDHVQDPMVLKIKNANYIPGGDPDITGTVELGARDGYKVPVTVTDAPEGYVLNVTVNGQPATVEDGYVILGQEPAYGEFVVVATVTCTGYNGELKDTKTYDIPQPTAANPEINFETLSDGSVVINIEGATRYEVLVDGEPYDGLIVEPIYDATQNVVVNAWNEPAGYIAGYATKSTTVAAKAYGTLAGNITFGAVDQATGKVHVLYTGNEEGVTLTINCTQVREVFNINGKEGDIELPHYGTFTLVATAKAPYYNDKTFEGVERTWEKAETTTAAPNIEAGLNETTHSYDIVATGDGEVTLHVTVYGADGTPTEYTVTGDGEASYSVPQTADVQYVSYWASAKDAADDYPGINNGESYVEVPAYVAPMGKTAAPSSQMYNDVIWDGPHAYHNEYHITLENASSDPDATIYYAIGVGTYNEETQQWTYEYPTDDEGNVIYMEYTGELIYTTPGTYMIDAYAVAPGKTESDHINNGFTVADATSVEELFADKTLAGVRYFNLAGQEMQEANGICISVYTFTDGTQVAVKVMQ